ncbi:MAG TPA: tyrosine-type recombinase/integrase [Candidatus Angelobacter sp.]|nr:tyrosine-type recombinase/integrase [Candidatus Angelobacter sp.]
MRTLRQAVDDYLTLRRGLGFKLQAEGVRLLDFVSFLKKKKVTHITTRVALEWAQQAGGRQGPRIRLRMVRIFAKYLAAFDVRTEVPPENLLPVKRMRRRPYIYSDKEVRRLLEAAWSCENDRPRGTYYCLFGLLIVSGMRIGEALRLQVKDVDLQNGILTVRDTKFSQSRLVPLHSSTVDELKKYKKQRDKLLGEQSSPHFFITPTGTPLYHQRVYCAFRLLLVQVGLWHGTAGGGPRLHDFRHRFAVRTLIDWYRSGGNVECRLPSLSTYLGHVSVDSTYWYLTEYPELMRLAVKRLEVRWEKADEN